ncbi:MAG: S1 RNA-binding domain-containing protein [Firmicutes bacterium]|jgi:S1 RNA binding domain protein|nr:S1 RNA-binding domain-containing protein [Bacillota bacterium]
MAIEVGSIVEGRVTGITNFGAFVELADGKTGLVHISEVADAYVKDINDYLKQNDRVKVKVININGNKIGLSIKQANTSSNDNRVNRRVSRQDFEERLSRFLRDSEQRQQDLRKSLDSKRGGRGGPARF